MMLTQWHAPVDDENCYWYTVFTSFGKPVDKAQMRAQRLEVYELPDYRSKKNRSNDYGFDPHEQEHKTYTGMGEDINVHDQWAVESQGRIQDRTREHLGSSDKAISAYRRLLQEIDRAGEEGRAARCWRSAPRRQRACAAPSPSTASAPTHRVATYAADTDRRRRERAPWPAVAQARSEAGVGMTFVERFAPWSDEQKEAAARVAPAGGGAGARGRPHRVSRPARPAARQDADRRRDGRTRCTTAARSPARCSPRTPPTGPCFRCGAPAAASASRRSRAPATC